MKWTTDNIETLMAGVGSGEHFGILENTYIEIIRSLLAQLREARQKTVKECAEIAREYATDLRNGDKQRIGANMVAMGIRQKFGGE